MESPTGVDGEAGRGQRSSAKRVLSVRDGDRLVAYAFGGSRTGNGGGVDTTALSRTEGRILGLR